jgi:hypothetical protein
VSLSKNAYQINSVPISVESPLTLQASRQSYHRWMADVKINKMKKALWRIAFAKTSIARAIQACDYVISNVQNLDSPIYYPLVTAIFVLYARPFGENTGAGKISSKYASFDSADKKNLHEMLIHGRNNLFAHVDAGTKYYDQGNPVGRVFELSVMVNDMKDGTFELTTHVLEPQLTLEAIPRIKSLSKELLKTLCNEEKLLLQLLMKTGCKFKLGKNVMAFK